LSLWGKTVSRAILATSKEMSPPVVVYPENREVYQEILTLHCYDDNSWLVLTQRFIYLYRIPTPNEKHYAAIAETTQEKTANTSPTLCSCSASGCLPDV
jgi:hypothetical protein